MESLKRRGWVGIILGTASVLAVAVLGYREKTADSPQFGLPLFIVLGIAGVAWYAAGINALMRAAHVEAGEKDEPVTYRHTFRLFGLVGGALLVALVARSLLAPPSFGKFGYYRGDAPSEEMTIRTPNYQGKQVCAKCHQMQFDAHEKDVHRTVQCEDCHGAGRTHVNADKKKGTIEVPRTKEWCLVCHRQIIARPGPFPQVSWKDHFAFVGVKDEKTECIACHDPHEPLFLQKPLSEARLHPLIQRCRDCHLGRPEQVTKRPDDHPPTFECSYCHAERAKDFQTRTHHQVACTTCHLFQKESEFSGRIVLNRDPRFCLLCHAKADFRSSAPPPGRNRAAPQLEWPGHLTQHEPGNTNEETSCLKCHAKNIHGPDAPPAATASKGAKR